MPRKPGPPPRNPIVVLREGNQGHHSKEKLSGGVYLPPEAPGEPDWSVIFPDTEEADMGEVLVARARASEEWRRIVPPLDAQGLLASVDYSTVTDCCVCEARLLLAERDITRRGSWVMGERGAVKNPSSTIAAQLRTAKKTYIAELGLSPSARIRLSPRKDGEQDDDAVWSA